MELFGKNGILDVMFTKPAKWGELSNLDKSKHLFMVQRFLAIKYPIQSNFYNKNGINPAAVLDTWQQFTKKFGSVPRWIYTKRNKQTTVKKKKSYTPSEEAIKLYCNRNSISLTQFEMAMELSPDVMIPYMKKLDKKLKPHAK